MAIFLNVFQHYLRSHVAMVTDNLEGIYSILKFFHTLITFDVS